MGISHPDHLPWRTDHQRVAALDLLHGTLDRIFHLLHVQAFSRNVISDHLRINGRLKDRTGVLQFMPKLHRIGDIPIVGDRKGSLDIIQDQRHGILRPGASRRRIPYMSDSQIPSQFIKILFIKYFIDQSQAFSGMHLSLTEGIRHRDPAALLSPVL